MTRPSKRDIERELEDLRDGDGTEYGEVLFVDDDGEVWGRAAGDGGIEPVSPGEYDDHEVAVVVDFSGGSSTW